MQAKDGPYCKELTSSSNDSLGPQRVGRGGVTVGDDGGSKDGSAATLGKTSQRFRGARARVCREAPPFQRSATALANLDTSRPKLCKSLSAGLASPSSAVDWMSCGSLSAAKIQTALSPPDPASFSGSRPHFPQPGFQFSLADDSLCLACPSSNVTSMKPHHKAPEQRIPLLPTCFCLAHLGFYSFNNLVPCLVLTPLIKCELPNKIIK